MDQRLKLSIGAWETEPPKQPQPSKPQIQSEGPVEGNVRAQASAMADEPTTLASESLAQIYQVLKRHEETPRDMVVEVRLLYQNLPEQERQRLEAQRERTTREVRDLFASQIRLLEEKISRPQRASQANNKEADVVTHVLGDDPGTSSPDNGYDEQELTDIRGAGQGGGGRPATPAPDPGPSPAGTPAPRPAPAPVTAAPAPAPAPGPGSGANLTPITVRVKHAQDVDCLETIGNNSVSYDTSIVSLAPIAASTPKTITLLGQKIGMTTVLIRYTNGKFAELSVTVTA